MQAPIDLKNLFAGLLSGNVSKRGKLLESLGYAENVCKPYRADEEERPYVSKFAIALREAVEEEDNKSVKIDEEYSVEQAEKAEETERLVELKTENVILFEKEEETKVKETSSEGCLIGDVESNQSEVIIVGHDSSATSEHTTTLNLAKPGVTKFEEVPRCVGDTFFRIKLYVEGELVVEATGPSKQKAKAAASKAYLEEKMTVKKQAVCFGERSNKTYGTCLKCGFFVRVNGHAERCRVVQSDNDSAHKIPRIVGDTVFRLVLVAIYEAIGGQCELSGCSEFISRYARKETQKTIYAFWKSACGEGLPKGRSDHSIADLLEQEIVYSHEVFDFVVATLIAMVLSDSFSAFSKPVMSVKEIAIFMREAMMQ